MHATLWQPFHIRNMYRGTRKFMKPLEFSVFLQTCDLKPKNTQILTQVTQSRRDINSILAANVCEL